MKDREWLGRYKINPKIDNSIYKNYQNPSLTSWDNMYGSLSDLQRTQYNKLVNEVPDEIKGKTAYDMQQYFNNIKQQEQQEVQKQQTLKKTIQPAVQAPRQNYDNLIWKRRKKPANYVAPAESPLQAALRLQRANTQRLQLLYDRYNVLHNALASGKPPGPRPNSIPEFNNIGEEFNWVRRAPYPQYYKLADREDFLKEIESSKYNEAIYERQLNASK